MFKASTLALLLGASLTGASRPDADMDQDQASGVRGLWSKRGYELELTINNLTYQQPFGPLFYMVHDDDVDPLFMMGQPSTEALQLLAEEGSPEDLYNMYKDVDGVYDIGTVMMPTGPGASRTISLKNMRGGSRVTVASMAVNTNDCFIALNGVRLKRGQTIDGVGYDAGTEENNENCGSIPGPACEGVPGNTKDSNGEGYVHIHRGVHGVLESGGLIAADTDWRNPMVRFEVN